MGTREFDIVLYGATGFVGALTAEYLLTAAPADTRIALAGRSAERLAKVRADLGPGAAAWPLIIADASDDASLDAMAWRTTVVVTTVGPYAYYGMPLVRACAEAGTHYADLTGEPLFIRDAAAAYHDTAARTGAKIVNSCGFDSIPSDLSVYLTYQQSVTDNTGELTDTTLVAAMMGGASAGTVASGRGMLEAVTTNPAELRTMLDPHALSPQRTLAPKVGPESDYALARANSIDASLRGWVTTFFMAPHNTKIVRRSDGLLGWVYGKNFRYREVMSTGKSAAAPVFAAGAASAYAALQAAGKVFSHGVGAVLTRGVGAVVTSRFGQKVLDFMLPNPGMGPTKLMRDRGWFRMTTIAHTTSGATYRTTFSAKGDPGYKSTSVMLGESALALAFDTLPTLAGVLTPATAIGAPLATRLRTAGMTITVERG